MILHVIGVPELPRFRVLGVTLMGTVKPEASEAKSVTQTQDAITSGEANLVLTIPTSYSKVNDG